MRYDRVLAATRSLRTDDVQLTTVAGTGAGTGAVMAEPAARRVTSWMSNESTGESVSWLLPAARATWEQAVNCIGRAFSSSAKVPVTLVGTALPSILITGP